MPKPGGGPSKAFRKLASRPASFDGDICNAHMDFSWQGADFSPDPLSAPRTGTSGAGTNWSLSGKC